MASVMHHASRQKDFQIKIDDTLGDSEHADYDTLEIGAEGLAYTIFLNREQTQQLSDMLLLYLAAERVKHAAEAEDEEVE